MINQKSRLVISLLGILIITLIIGIKLNYTKEVADSKQTPIKASFSESYLAQTELVKISDLVAEVKISGEKAKLVKTFEVNGEKDSFAAKANTTIKIEAPVTIYDVEILDIIKGVEKSKKIDLIFPNISIDSLNTSIKLGKTYLLYLYKNENYGEKAYSIVSFSQGIYLANNEDVVVNGEYIKLDEYKKNIRSIIE